MSTRMITLSVTVEGAEDYIQLFQHLSELAANLPDSTYVAVSASVLDNNPDEPDQICCDHEHLHYDDQTLNKFADALLRALPPGTFSLMNTAEVRIRVIEEAQNAGILFREAVR